MGFGAKHPLDLLISHAHVDHLNGVERLLDKVNGLTVKTIVLPLLNVEVRLVAYARRSALLALPVPAGHGQDLARREGGFVAGQERDHVGHLLGPAQAPEQASIEEALALALGEPLDDAGLDDPGGD